MFEVRIVRGKNRESKGLAFVEFCAVEAVEAALKQERSVMGRTLKVEKHKLAEVPPIPQSCRDNTYAQIRCR